MFANRILNVVLHILAFILVPVQLVTTFVIGLLVSITFGLLLIPISIVWTIFFFGPLLGLSWLCWKISVLRNLIGIIFLPWAVLAEIFVSLMPSMGEIENRTAKLMLCDTWPFTWEFWQFWSGRIDINSPKSKEERMLIVIIARLSNVSPLVQRVVKRMINGEQLDPNL